MLTYCPYSEFTLHVRFVFKILQVEEQEEEEENEKTVNIAC